MNSPITTSNHNSYPDQIQRNKYFQTILYKHVHLLLAQRLYHLSHVNHYKSDQKAIRKNSSWYSESQLMRISLAQINQNKAEKRLHYRKQ